MKLKQIKQEVGMNLEGINVEEYNTFVKACNDAFEENDAVFVSPSTGDVYMMHHDKSYITITDIYDKKKILSVENKQPSSNMWLSEIKSIMLGENDGQDMEEKAYNVFKKLALSNDDNLALNMPYISLRDIKSLKDEGINLQDLINMSDEDILIKYKDKSDISIDLSDENKSLRHPFVDIKRIYKALDSLKGRDVFLSNYINNLHNVITDIVASKDMKVQNLSYKKPINKEVIDTSTLTISEDEYVRYVSKDNVSLHHMADKNLVVGLNRFFSVETQNQKLWFDNAENIEENSILGNKVTEDPKSYLKLQEMLQQEGYNEDEALLYLSILLSQMSQSDGNKLKDMNFDFNLNELSSFFDSNRFKNHNKFIQTSDNELEWCDILHQEELKIKFK